ncbi:unnamed protein product [Pieris macdunnoughi]|uniref:Uncharacterized protein n=1 Tax=Pieris macdunnoughi TaxID=345717 RepID=A0A821SEM3_9NEOP|nr:unnamed protein product [Pieris macdunnoughi]
MTGVLKVKVITPMPRVNLRDARLNKIKQRTVADVQRHVHRRRPVRLWCLYADTRVGTAASAAGPAAGQPVDSPGGAASRESARYHRSRHQSQVKNTPWPLTTVLDTSRHDTTPGPNQASLLSPHINTSTTSLRAASRALCLLARCSPYQRLKLTKYHPKGEYAPNLPKHS